MYPILPVSSRTWNIVHVDITDDNTGQTWNAKIAAASSSERDDNRKEKVRAMIHDIGNGIQAIRACNLDE